MSQNFLRNVFAERQIFATALALVIRSPETAVAKLEDFCDSAGVPRIVHGGTAERLRDTLAQVSPPATIARAGSPVFPFLLAACARPSSNSEVTSQPIPIGSRSPGRCPDLYPAPKPKGRGENYSALFTLSLRSDLRPRATTTGAAPCLMLTRWRGPRRHPPSTPRRWSRWQPVCRGRPPCWRPPRCWPGVRLATWAGVP